MRRLPGSDLFEFQAAPGQRDRLRTLVEHISATYGPRAPGFLGSTVHETLDSEDGLVEIAEWESAQAQEEAVREANDGKISSDVLRPVLESVRRVA